MVRAHGKIDNLSYCELCRIFNLTANGAWEILKGDEWRPEYSMDAERERRLSMIRDAGLKWQVRSETNLPECKHA